MEQNLLLENESTETTSGPVECLGLAFENDEARRAHFTKLLAEKLKDPEFRKIEGFPIGTDESILELSDPPFYTACPNPWINDFISLWESQKETLDEDYHREPFAADVSEGKSDPIYNAHSYHTKVPHKAIMRYILHYTNPGDIVFDGFCGTGMTGVAAKLCGDKKVVESLGLFVNENDEIFEQIKGSSKLRKISVLGRRHAVLNDLSPVATFIAENYNSPVNVREFERKADAILSYLEDKYSWLYKTQHDEKNYGEINYTVWSDVFVCSECSNEIIFTEVAVKDDKVSDVFNCNHCNTSLKKRGLERAFVSNFDNKLQQSIKQSKRVPVFINYSFEGKNYNKILDALDIANLEKISNFEIMHDFPHGRMMEGKETRRNDSIGLTHTHHYYSKKTLMILSEFRQLCNSKELLLLFNSQLINLSLLNRYRPGVSFPYNPLSGTMYVGSQISEANVFTAYRNKLKKLVKAFKNISEPSVISTMSLTEKQSCKADYIFIDPPFGANLNYSELSSLWEEWLGVKTNNELEAIENSAQNKKLDDYRKLMAQSFYRAYEVLKPGGWATIEFSNTKAAVWNSIQTALNEAGFVIANVSALDKQSLSFKAVNTPTAVKQDLVISAYKPTEKFQSKFSSDSEEESVWDFVFNHLNHLPIAKFDNNQVISFPERDPRIIYDRLVSYFINNGKNIPLNSSEFLKEIAIKLPERDGMYFLPEQVQKYDKVRMSSKNVIQFSIFVNDEASAIEWLRKELKEKPSSYSELHPKFLNELSGWKKYEVQLELSELLEQNFIKYEPSEEVPSQIHSYLSTNYKELRGLDKTNALLKSKASGRWYVPDHSKQSDIEKIRKRTLIKEFDSYKLAKKVKTPRIEALRTGFEKCFEEQDFETILDIASKVPVTVIQEDEKLLMFFDNANTLMSQDDWD